MRRGQRRVRCRAADRASAREPRGLLVAMEGIDGSGTTTQVRRLVRRLRRHGIAASATREPSDGRVGRYTRELLGRSGVSPERLALLFAADRLDHYEEVLAPALASGRVVVCDRYLLSSLAYQGVECAPRWVAALNRFAPPPDVTILLDVDPRVAAARRRRRGRAGDRYEVDEFLLAVARRYRLLARRGTRGKVVRVPAHDDPSAVADRVWRAVWPLVQRRLQSTISKT